MRQFVEAWVRQRGRLGERLDRLAGAARQSIDQNTGRVQTLSGLQPDYAGQLRGVFVRLQADELAFRERLEAYPTLQEYSGCSWTSPASPARAPHPAPGALTSRPPYEGTETNMFLLGPGDHEDAFSLEWLRDVPVWKAHVAVLHEPWRGDEPQRALIVVMGGGDVVHDEVVDASAVRTPEGAARALGDALHAVAKMAKGYPRTLLVGEWATAVRLAAELDPHHVDVRVSPSLRTVHRAIRLLAAGLDLPDFAWELVPLRGWNEDGVDSGLAGALFPAAARFWRARSWERTGEGEAFLARWRDRDSVVVLTHPRGHGYVATLFTSRWDYERQEFPARPERMVLGIRFAERDGVPRAIRRQVASFGWEVAGPEAYPLVLADGPSFGEGLAPDDVHHLAAVLDAVAAWTESHGAARSALPFTGAENGVELEPYPAGPEMDAVPWPTMKRARPACAVGPADAREPVRTAERDRVESFASRLRAGGVRETAGGLAALVAEWARFLDGHTRLPAEAATEYDLRLFLYDWYPLYGAGSEDEAERLPTALRRYFRWLREHEGIAYPWAGAVLRERDAYRERLDTAPLGRDPDEDDEELTRWRACLYRDLDARVLLRDRGFPDPTLEWWERPDTPRVAALVRELQRLWLIWRDEEVAAGNTSPGRLRAALLARQREWERSPHPDHGASPIRVTAEHGSG